MSGIGDVIGLFRDLDFDALAAQADQELVVALAGQGNARDRLYRALATRLDSLWQSSPFRLVENAELAAIGAAAIPAADDNLNSDRKRLLIYAVPQGETVADATATRLRHLLDTPGIGLIVVVLPQPSATERDPLHQGVRAKRPARFRSLGPARLRILEGRARPSEPDRYDVSAADSSSPRDESTAYAAQLGLLNFPVSGSAVNGGSFHLVTLDSLDLGGMEGDLFPAIIRSLPERELALARRAPIFQNAVANHVIMAAARKSAESVALANVTANIPFLPGLLNVDGSDLVLLTGSQIGLSHKLAIIYGQKRDTTAEVWLEAVPFVIAAFLWRWVARRTVSAMPVSQAYRPFLAPLPRVALAYGGTWLTGQAARMYYATGQRRPLADLRAFIEQRQWTGLAAQVVNVLLRGLNWLTNRDDGPTDDATPGTGRAAQ